MTTLANSAFGTDPGRWPLPSASTGDEHWFRAVAAGGQGRYAAARAELDAVASAGGPIASLASSTRASFLRQLGWHAAARGWDGRALAAAGRDPEARADALIGLAADALGVARFALSARLLECAIDVVVAGCPERLPVRWAWVSAELAMVTGRGDDAVGHAERAVALAGESGSTRHAVKSAVVHAAALCSTGARDAAREVADTAIRHAQDAGLIPLTWALSCLLGDVGSAVYDADEIADLRARSADLVQFRGGAWAQR